MKATRLLGSGAAAAGAGILAYGAYAAATWARYGHPRPERHPPDELLDQFWTLAAEPLGPERSRFVSRTRVVTTDPVARRRFRRYWAPMSAGIILIRYLSLPMVRREAERRTRHRGGE
jgi:hypothetical protein